nr:expressed conserved protein [Hymenolepis microstoma]
MPSSDPSDTIVRHFIKHTETTNFKRAQFFKTRKNKSLIVAVAAAAFAIGTYAFSVNSVRQGRYLDESFDRVPYSK